MKITKEKIEALAKYMAEDIARTEMLMELSAEDACARINADGYDFTAEELAEFAKGITEVTTAKQGELSCEELESVSGGLGVGEIALALIVWQGSYAWNKGQEWGDKLVKWWRNK